MFFEKKLTQAYLYRYKNTVLLRLLRQRCILKLYGNKFKTTNIYTKPNILKRKTCRLFCHLCIYNFYMVFFQHSYLYVEDKYVISIFIFSEMFKLYFIEFCSEKV